MGRHIVSVGIDIPGGEMEGIDLSARHSLLDYDIIVFRPGFPTYYSHDEYQGKPCLSDSESLNAKEAVAHWRREISAAYQAGKMVVVLLEAPKAIFVATGEMTYSGTGRNARATRIVTEIIRIIRSQFRGSFMNLLVRR